MIRMLLASVLTIAALMSAAAWLERLGVPEERLERAWRAAASQLSSAVESLRAAPTPTPRVRTLDLAAALPEMAAPEAAPRASAAPVARRPEPEPPAEPAAQQPVFRPASEPTEVWRDSFEPTEEDGAEAVSVAVGSEKPAEGWGSDWEGSAEDVSDDTAQSGDRASAPSVAAPGSPLLADAMSLDERSHLIRRMLAVHARLAEPLAGRGGAQR